MFVEIIRPPIGEAPEWVREAWVGLHLPLARRTPRSWHGVGVLTGPKSLLGLLFALVTGRTTRTRGYAVNAKAAVELLAGKNEAAANWWRQNSPHMLNGRRYFVFDADSCRAATSS